MREALQPLKHSIKPGIYKHYSGSLYKVFGTGRHSETLEELVFYRDLDKPELLWARPAAMFLEVVEYNGKITDRFTFVRENK